MSLLRYKLIGFFRKRIDRVPPEIPPDGFQPSLDFSNRFNSQYLPLL